MTIEEFNVITKAIENECLMVAEKVYRCENVSVKVAFEHIYIPRLHLELSDRLQETIWERLPFFLMNQLCYCINLTN